MPMYKKPRRQRVKRYRRSFYTRQAKIKKAVSILVLAAVVLALAWLAAPYLIDWATHTWYTVVRDRDLSASASVSQSVSQPESEPAASSEPAESEAAASSEPEIDPAPEAVHTGVWATVSLSALTDEAAIRAQAQALYAQGVEYALVPLKDASGYIYYDSAVPAAAGSVAATVVDPALIASIFQEEGLTPAASLTAFQDPIAAYTDRSMAIQYAGDGAYLWLDAASAAAGGKPWLNPYSASAVQFVGDLIAEVQSLGFDQVVLGGVQFPPVVSSKQNFGDTGSLSRAQALAADIASWQARFEGTVTLWYEYPLSSCLAADNTTGALPPELGVQNLIIQLPTDETASEQTRTEAAQAMLQLGVQQLALREGSAAQLYAGSVQEPETGSAGAATPESEG